MVFCHCWAQGPSPNCSPILARSWSIFCRPKKVQFRPNTGQETEQPAGLPQEAQTVFSHEPMTRPNVRLPCMVVVSPAWPLGRIEDGIKRGRIMNTGASKEERKRFVLNEHVQAMSEEENRSHATREELVKNHPHSSSYAQVPQVDFPSPQKFVRKHDRDSDSSCHRGNKGKRAKVYHSLSMTYEELLLVLIQNYGISVIFTKPRRPPYPRGYDVNATCEYHGGVRGHSVENCKALKDKVQSLLYTDPIKFRKLISDHQEH